MASEDAGSPQDPEITEEQSSPAFDPSSDLDHGPDLSDSSTDVDEREVREIRDATSPMAGAGNNDTNDNDDNGSPDGSDGSDGSDNDTDTSNASDDTIEKHAKFIDGMTYVAGLMHKLGIASVAGFLHEGLNYEVLKAHPRALRAIEAAPLDGAWILDEEVDASLADLTYAQRLYRLGIVGEEATGSNLTFHDSKASISQTPSRELVEHRKRFGKVGRRQSDKQTSFASILHMNIHAIPGMIFLSPPHSMGTARLGFEDVMMYETHLPVPYMPLAVPLEKFTEAQENWRHAQANGTKYIVPGSGVEVDVWPNKGGSSNLLLSANDPAWRAFDILFQAINGSHYAGQNKITLEFATFQPLGGDGQILWDGHPPETVELKLNLVKEITNAADEIIQVQISQVGANEMERKRRSAFHPNRTHSFLILLKPGRSLGYCLPASALSPEYWNDELEFLIPYPDIAKFKFSMVESDWFADLHQRIIIPNAQSQRPEHEIPANAVAENYGPAAALEVETADVPTKAELKTLLAGYPWWKIERWNRRAAHKGYGVYIPLSRESKIANVVWVGWRWSVQEKVRYFATQQLPVKFHQGDVWPHTPVMLIRAISVRTDKNKWATDFPTRVNGWRLDPGPFPCLYYVDCGNYRMNHVERSGLLFPQEYIDYELLNKRYSNHLGQNVRSGREFFNKAGRAGTSAAGHLARLTNLERILKAPYTGFMVREGEDFDDAINNFFYAHVNEEKPLTWYNYAKLTATDNYVVTARDVWQALADEWIIGGTIKNPARNIDHGADDDSDDESPGLDGGDDVEDDENEEGDEDNGDDEGS